MHPTHIRTLMLITEIIKDRRCECLWTKWSCNAQTGRRHISNPTANDRRTLGNHFAPEWQPVTDEASIHHRLIADQSQVGHHYIAKRPIPFIDETYRRAVRNQTAMKLKPLHDILETSETSQRPNQLRPVCCACSKDSSRPIWFGARWRRCGDVLATSIKPFGDLWDFFAIVILSSRREVALYVWSENKQGTFL